MTPAVRVTLTTTALLVAILLHIFHVDYVTGIDDPNARDFLLSWKAIPLQRESFVHKLSTRAVKPEQIKFSQSPSQGSIENLRWRHMSKYCKWPGLDFSQMTCSRKFIEPKITRTRVVVPEVNYDQARLLVDKSLSGATVQFGMVPSSDIAGDEEPSRAAMMKCFWLGIISPLILVGLSLSLIIPIFRRKAAKA